MIDVVIIPKNDQSHQEAQEVFELLWGTMTEISVKLIGPSVRTSTALYLPPSEATWHGALQVKVTYYGNLVFAHNVANEYLLELARRWKLLSSSILFPDTVELLKPENITAMVQIGNFLSGGKLS